MTAGLILNNHFYLKMKILFPKVLGKIDSKE